MILTEQQIYNSENPWLSLEFGHPPRLQLIRKELTPLSQLPPSTQISQVAAWINEKLPLLREHQSYGSYGLSDKQSEENKHAYEQNTLIYKQRKAAFLDCIFVWLDWLTPSQIINGMAEAMTYVEAGTAHRIVRNWAKLFIGSEWEPETDTLVAQVLRHKHLHTLGDFQPLNLTDVTPVEWLVQGILVKGQSMVGGGPTKSLKTTFFLDLAVSLVSGHPFLGLYEVAAPVNVVFFSGESGQATLKETVKRIAAEKGITDEKRLAEKLFVYDRLPPLGLLPDLVQQHQAGVVVIDPLYLMLRGAQQSSLSEIGCVLADLTAAVAPATLIVLHHTTKAVRLGRSLSINDLSGAGVAEWARQWILLNRRVRYEPKKPGSHRLVLAAGGSAGHAVFHNVDVEEGTLDSGRFYHLSVDSPEAEKTIETPKQTPRREPASLAERAQRVVAAMDEMELPLNKKIPSKRVSNSAKLNWALWTEVRQYLIDTGYLSPDLVRLR